MYESGMQRRREPQRGPGKTFSRNTSGEKIFDFLLFKMAHSGVFYATYFWVTARPPNVVRPRENLTFRFGRAWNQAVAWRQKEDQSRHFRESNKQCNIMEQKYVKIQHRRDARNELSVESQTLQHRSARHDTPLGWCAAAASDTNRKLSRRPAVNCRQSYTVSITA